MQESNKILQIIRKIIIQISLDYKKNEFNENKNLKKWGNLYIFRKNFRKNKNIQNFMIKNHKIKLPTNKFTDVLKFKYWCG